MDARKFVVQLFRLIRKYFPELYHQNIKRRRDEFVNENSPPEMPGAETWEVKRLGRLNKDFRFLFALAESLSKASRLMFDLSQKTNDPLHLYHQYAQSVSLGEVVLSCRDEFWSLVEECFLGKINRETHFFWLRTDWSIFAVDRRFMPEMEMPLERQRLHSIQCHLNVLTCIRKAQELVG